MDEKTRRSSKPINIKTSSVSYKTQVNDKLIEYTIEFDNSSSVLNDIR